MSSENLKATVRKRYGNAALQVATGAKTGCCGGGSCATSEDDPITSNLYSDAETATLPAEAVLASLGCGNPTALAELHEGEVVLDLGSGGGIDVLLSARRVGPSGKAYGLDMTDEMLALARENQRKAGVENVEFLKGDIEAIPLPAASVDVIISNCVVNLAADKRKVINEAFRVLKPGGRFAVSDVGFEHIDIEPTRIYEFEDAKTFLTGAGLDTEVLAREVGGRVMGAFIRATKPVAVTTVANAAPAGLSRACCGPECCA